MKEFVSGPEAFVPSREYFTSAFFLHLNGPIYNEKLELWISQI